MNIEFSQKAGTWLSVAILVLIVGGYLGIYSGLQYMRDRSSEVTTQKEIYLKQNDRLEKLKDFQSKLDQAKETIALMNEALPVEEHRLSVISVLSNLASRSGAKLISIVNETSEEVISEEGMEGEISEEEAEVSGLVETVQGPELATQNLTVSIAGDYSKINRFLASLENNRRPLNPQTLQITKSGLELSLVHYYLKEENDQEGW